MTLLVSVTNDTNTRVDILAPIGYYVPMTSTPPLPPVSESVVVTWSDGFTSAGIVLDHFEDESGFTLETFDHAELAAWSDDATWSIIL